MERNIRRSVVVPSSSLEGKEYLAVGPDGALTANTGDYVYGIVERGRPANEGSSVIVGGECYAYVGEDVDAGDHLTGGANGKLMKARMSIDFDNSTYTFDRHQAVALEDASANGLCRVLLLG